MSIRNWCWPELSQRLGRGRFCLVVAALIAALLPGPALLAGGDAPTITTQPPTTFQARLGMAIRLQVTATGTSPLTYQWRRNGEPILPAPFVNGAQSSTLEIARWSNNNQGMYDVVVTNAFGEAVSDPTSVIVSFPLAGDAQAGVDVLLRTPEIGQPGYDANAFVHQAQVDESGRVAFAGRFFLDGQVRSAVALADPDGVTLIAEEGDLAPGPSGAEFADLSRITHSPDGRSGLPSSVGFPIPDPLKAGLWFHDEVALDFVASHGGSAPGMPIGSVFAEFQFSSGFRSVFPNGPGRMNVLAHAEGPSLPPNGVNGIWEWTRQSGLALIVHAGQVPPGLSGSFIQLDSIPMGNDAGDIVFMGRISSMTGFSSSDPFDNVIWLRRSGQITTILRSGDQPAGIAPSVNVDTINSVNYFLSPSGRVLCDAGLAGQSGFAGNAVIEWDQAQGATIVAKRGDTAVGVDPQQTLGNPEAIGIGPDDTLYFRSNLLNNPGAQSVFRGVWTKRMGFIGLVGTDILPELGFPPNSFSRVTGFSSVSSNNAGQCVFTGTLTAGGASSKGLFAWSPRHGSRPILLRGHQVEVSPGVFKTVDFVKYTFEAGDSPLVRDRNLNADGATAVSVQFHDLTQAVLRIRLRAEPCAGDADASGKVEFQDIVDVLSHWGGDYRPASGSGDANSDGLVDFSDVVATLSNWGNACAD